MLQTEPLDTLFFRNGKPFNRGENNWGESLFPPYPSVFYGALRTAFFAQNPQYFPLAGTSDDPTSSLRIRGMFLKAWGDSYYFPLPRDLIQEKNAGDNCAFPLQLLDTPSLSNCSLPKVLASPPDLIAETIGDGWIDQVTLSEYLANSSKQFYFSDLKDFVTEEAKIGIKLTPGRSAEDQMLYRAGMLRLSPRQDKGKAHQECSFIIDYEGINLPEQGFLKLGGEGKATHYKHIHELDKNSLIPAYSAPKHQVFKIYLLTPAILNNGWLPDWINPDTFFGHYQGLKVKLLTAALGKHLFIGGFDIKKRKPKPMHRAVPAGSVYYFELLEGEAEKVKEVFHYQPFENTPYAMEGYGIGLVGGMDE
nr:type III-B CRISPR module-associated protein Cmr3 [Dehalobacterium formicoaceticum]